MTNQNSKNRKLDEYDAEKTLSALKNIIDTYSNDVFPAPGNDVLFLLENYQKCIDYAKKEFGNDEDINMLSGHHYDWVDLEGEELKIVTKQIVAKAKTLTNLIGKKTGINIDNQQLIPSLTSLENLLNRFGEVIIQLKTRKRNKTPLTIDDEYDVQYLLHSLLKINFKEVIDEDAAQSSFGANSFIDFTLPEIEAGIECKKTRENLKDKELGEEMIADVHKYEGNERCKILYFLIDDTKHILKNPETLKSEFEKIPLVRRVFIVR